MENRKGGRGRRRRKRRRKGKRYFPTRQQQRLSAKEGRIKNKKNKEKKRM